MLKNSKMALEQK